MVDDVAIMVGRRLRSIREATGLTQAELAALALKSVETVSNFERGRTLPSIRTLALLAERLDCSVADFFDLSAVRPRHDDPFIAAVTLKSKLLSERDKTLLFGILDLMTSQSRD